VLGGKVGINDHIVLHDGAMVNACSCVSKDLPAGSQVFGIPAVDKYDFFRERARVRQLPRLVEDFKALIERVERLESAADD
jgi:UDP-3-O-[3-hydroxymyristoyl] glucosamine N-acyltransferase